MEAVRQDIATNKPRPVTIGDIDQAIWQKLDDLVDMQGEIFGRLSHVEKAIAVASEPEKSKGDTVTPTKTTKPSQPAQGLTNAQLGDLTGTPKSTIERWKAKLKAGESLAKIRNPEANKWELGKDGLWYPKD